jgi:transcriptional regulator with XRE-family HTH domain
VKKLQNDRFLTLFGKKLAEVRKQKGFSQEQLSYDSDISLSSISKIERGILNISIANVYKLAKILKVHHKDLFDFDV